MSTEKKLDYAILGLLCQEELTGYEIKKRFDLSLKYFWGASFGSIYPTLNGLVANGRATRRDTIDNGRNKAIYTITEEGRMYLRNWLVLPVEKDEMRYETMLKLFFGNEAGPVNSLEHVHQFRDKAEKDLAYLRETEKVIYDMLKEEDSMRKHYLLTVRFGIKSYEAYLEWCHESEKLLKEM